MINIRTILVLFILMSVCILTDAQYIRQGNKYVQISNRHRRYDGDIKDQFYYRDVNYVFAIGILYRSYIGECTLDSLKVSGSVMNGKENGLFSFYLMNGSLIATAEMKSGKLYGRATFYIDNQTPELYVKNRRIIKNITP